MQKLTVLKYLVYFLYREGYVITIKPYY